MNLLFLTVVLVLQSDSIIECPERELWPGDSGSWIPEAHITEENARKALVHLEKYVSGEIAEISASGWELDATVKVLEGYILKRLSEAEFRAIDADNASTQRSRYCLWLTRRGFYLGAVDTEVSRNNPLLQSTGFPTV